MIFLALLAILVSGILIWYGSGLFEDASDYLGRNLSDGVKGASINAIASSMPELLTGFIFLFFVHGSDGYSGTIGTTAGSAVFNSLLIPSLVILTVTLFGTIKSISVSRKVIIRDSFFLLVAELMLIGIINTNVIGIYDGWILVALYIVYLIYMFGTMTKKEPEPYWKPHGGQTGKSILLLIVSIIIMVIGSYILVEGVVYIGDSLGIHLMFVSIILASAASSIPDTFISMRDAKKGNYNDAVSNAIGSNIFDICIAHGLPLGLYTLIYGDVIMTFSTTTNSVELRVWLLILTFITIMIFLFNKKMTKWTGFILIILYAIFITFVVGKAYDYDWAVQLGYQLSSIVGR